MEFNAEFWSAEKAWLLIFDNGIERSIQVSDSDVKEIMDCCQFLLDKFEAARTDSKGEAKEGE